MTLGALRGLDVPAEGVELVVVDNASTDRTQDVVESFAATMPFPTRLVFEGRLGHSHAFNTAIEQTRGEVLAFTDDDAAPRPDWPRQIVRAFSEFQADIVFGKVRPLWETGRPRWYSEKRFEGMFALLDYGDDSFIVTDHDRPFYGVNHAVRRTTFDQLGGYRLDRGASGAVGALGNDIDLFERCLAGGARIVYDPAVVVDHFIPAARSTKREQRRMLWNKSAMTYLGMRETYASDVSWFGLPRWQYRQALYHALWLARDTLTRNESEAFFHELRLRRFLGLFRKALRHRPRSLMEGPPGTELGPGRLPSYESTDGVHFVEARANGTDLARRPSS